MIRWVMNWWVLRWQTVLVPVDLLLADTSGESGTSETKKSRRGEPLREKATYPRSPIRTGTWLPVETRMGIGISTLTRRTDSTPGGLR
jgi:hypothetical protein